MKTIRTHFGALMLALGALMLMATPGFAQWPTQTLPAEDVANTKHNFFTNQDTGYDTTNTAEICVFCHTPHGGQPTDTSTAAPLWNRAMPDTGVTTYQMYNSPNFDSFVTGVQPQGVSLACLSCHDGTVGIDSLINAPGSGGFVLANKNASIASPGPDISLQFQAATTLGVLGPAGTFPGAMSDQPRPSCVPGSAVVNEQCFHSPLGPQTNAEFFAGAPVNFVGSWGMTPFPNLTPDLRDDHPISMQIPSAATDPQFTAINASFVNSRADGFGVTWLGRFGANNYNTDPRDRLRAYPTGGANTEYVECASCHNPHTPRPLFLRLPNVATAGAPGTLLQLASGGGTTPWSASTGGPEVEFISNNPNFQSAICISCHEK